MMRPDPVGGRFPPRGSHRLRIGRRSEAGIHYFVTTKSFDRQPLFNNPSIAGIVTRSIERFEREGRWEWLCYVLMPDHLHVVFVLKEHETLERVFQALKSYTADRINRTLARRGTIWQDGYFDHRLRSYEKLVQVAFYCFQNPVNAGLVLDGHDWPLFKCKQALWAEVEEQFENLLALEHELRSWRPSSDGQ